MTTDATNQITSVNWLIEPLPVNGKQVSSVVALNAHSTVTVARYETVQEPLYWTAADRNFVKYKLLCQYSIQ